METEKPIAKKKNGGARPGAGRPAFVPTDDERRQVEAMSGYGVPLDQIAALVRSGIGSDTLRAHFAPQLLAGKALANSKIGQRLFQKALDGDTTAMIWWTKTQMQWRETKQIEIVETATATGHELTDAQLLEIAKGGLIDAR